MAQDFEGAARRGASEAADVAKDFAKFATDFDSVLVDNPFGAALVETGDELQLVTPFGNIAIEKSFAVEDASVYGVLVFTTQAWVDGKYKERVPLFSVHMKYLKWTCFDSSGAVEMPPSRSSDFVWAIGLRSIERLLILKDKEARSFS